MRPQVPMTVPDDLILRARDVLAYSTDPHERGVATGILRRAERQRLNDAFGRLARTCELVTEPDDLPPKPEPRRGRLFFGLLRG